MTIGRARVAAAAAWRLSITEREGKAKSNEPPTGRQNTDHIKIIVLFGAGISRPEICARPDPGGEQPLRLPLNAKPGRHIQAHKAKANAQAADVRAEGKPSSGGPRRRRGGPQVAVLASGSSSKAQAHAQAADVAGQWASHRAMGRGAGEAGRKSPSWRANAAAAPLPPHKTQDMLDPWRHGTHGRLHRKSRSLLLPARRWTLPRAMCHNAFYRQRGEDV